MFMLSMLSFSSTIPLRTIGVNPSAGRWIGDPQAAYDYMRSELQKKQTTIPELFWCKDEWMLLGSSCQANTDSIS